ncbi:FAD dependent oxidoreductase [Gemmatirosa kalamazoonensis]|uniref:FAD dependent oxidoreductase n=1 Tax=Gemmatirosa kalamazoonensis TaxID=861299 RepID=W0RFI5_9BACT|nr:FAD-dependent oxidoreductase [Gemmatirosa kalamazoonensis]AHG89561.1 FAD dependent oxidoreductase [Gemmatirosa kalamazoonensis]
MMTDIGLIPTPAVWEDAPGLDLPTLGGEVEADVCVVGLGGSGLAAVRALTAAGRRVVGIDAGEVACGAAGRNGGFLLAGLYEFHHDAVAKIGRARARRLYELTIAEVARLAAETPEAVRLVGSLRVAASPEEEDDCRAQLAAMRADALPVEWYEGPEGHGLLVPTDGAMHPLRRVRALATRALGDGARLFERTRAVDIAGDVVRTDGGTVRCGGVVVAVDGALDRLLPELAPRVRTARLQMLATAPAPEVHVPRPVYARWGYDYWQQLADGAIALGGARDVGGDAEWTHDARPTAPVQRALETLLRDRLGVRAPVVRRWAALVGYSDTGLPVLAEVRPGVWACGAYSGTGNVLGALCGRAAALHAAGAPDAAARELVALLRGAD